LADSTGARRTLKVADAEAKEGFVERTWHVNAVNECKLCHNAGANFVLGFVPEQLGDELQRLVEVGVVPKAPPAESGASMKLVTPHDTAETIDDRARSYLHVNCSMCHHPRGNAIVSFYLRRDMPFEKLNTNKGTGIGTFGMQNARIIAPGDPYRSVLFYRMSKLGYARMPYIGSRVVDSAGVALMEQWIRSLPAMDKSQLSAPLQPESPAAKALASLTDREPDSVAARGQALKTLLESTEGALALLTQMHRGTLPPETQQMAIALGTTAKGDIRGLVETFVPEAQRRPTLGGKFEPGVVLNREGDLGRGKLIFFSDGARCRNCHASEDREQSVGPTIQEINKKYPRPAELLQHVVQPSLKIEEPYAAYAVLTDDGRSLVGLLAEQSEKSVTLKTAEKKLIRLPRSEIVQMKKSDKSLMPDQVLSDLTAQEAADLFAYLRSLGAAK
jgi:putative heme-binding domain-containing protein